MKIRNNEITNSLYAHFVLFKFRVFVIVVIHKL